jgi:hypothetical protein
MSYLYRGHSIDASYQVSEEKIKMWKLTDRRHTTDATLVVMGTDCTGSCKSSDHDHDGPR